jgi:nucleolin
MKMYVGNLPYSVDDAQLAALFGPHGPVVSARVVLDRETGRSKGFGFVEMSDSAAKAAITSLNSSQLEGRTIFVNEARIRPGA